jgi:hypothetical protein
LQGFYSYRLAFARQVFLYPLKRHQQCAKGNGFNFALYNV